jgi:hypothetical protein
MGVDLEDSREFFDLPLEEQRNLIKAALAEIVPGGEVKETAGAVGLSAYTLYKWRDPECESHNGLRPELLQIIRLTRGYRFLHFLAGLFDHIVLPRPSAATSIEDISRHIATLLREVAVVSQTALEAAAPNSPGGPKITLEEFHHLRREICRAQEQLAGLEEAAWLQAKQEHSWGTRVLHRLKRRT